MEYQLLSVSVCTSDESLSLSLSLHRSMFRTSKSKCADEISRPSLYLASFEARFQRSVTDVSWDKDQHSPNRPTVQIPNCGSIRHHQVSVIRLHRLHWFPMQRSKLTHPFRRGPMLNDQSILGFALGMAFTSKTEATPTVMQFPSSQNPIPVESTPLFPSFQSRSFHCS